MHARVIHAAEDKLLRLEGSLGPLQALSATSILTFARAPKDGGTTLVVTYRVAGNEAAGLQLRGAGGRRDRRECGAWSPTWRPASPIRPSPKA
jgi:hypothetical protein